ncbi:SPFH domain-containing protein [Cellulomonas soli]|uniref:Paraslipin n=1 Tax=Cellulomonas soli TaxID=931535 RepID=A0A512P8F8_9CELL|nr:SPFH domain-containing protein [Cellulomonas soli]NYI57712.1 prepilin-type processing-associated H-X9-DG protein [Cellulomonas soli]GEP67493.1 paraslipin [Cellulomonas soli]
MPVSQILGPVVGILIVLIVLGRTLKTVDQAHVAVVTVFGKYRRVLNPGLNVLIPFIEKVHRRVPVQNQTAQLQFSAITGDQAAVHFTATIIFTVSDHSPQTVQLVAFKFIDANSFGVALTSAVEASVREFVATKRQAEVLGLRTDIVQHAKANLDEQLGSWGYTLVDLTVNDIQFDAEVMSSMSRVVAAKNAQTAAEFEGQALLIARTKAAEAEGAAIKIAAESEAEAARLRGAGLAKFREELAKGISQSAQVLEAQGVGAEMLAFTMWTETIRDAAKEGTGNVVFLDGSVEAMDASLRRLQGLTVLQTAAGSKN